MTDILLTDLIESHAYPQVEKAYAKLHPEVHSLKSEDLKVAYKSIKDLADIEDSNFLLSISMEEESSEEWEHVYGKFGVDSKERWALSFIPWSEWLGMRINAEALDEYASSEILAHCLYEMTIHGYSEKEIQKQKVEVTDDVDNFDLIGQYEVDDQNEGLAELRHQLKYEIESSSED